MKQKTHKATAKRFQITKKKKLLKRYAGQNHFNSRDTGSQTRKKRRDVTMGKANEKTIKHLINS